MFLNKSLCCIYNEVHHGEVPMDDVGGTIKNLIFRKVKSGRTVVYTPKEFTAAAMKFVPSIITVYLPKSDEIVEPESIRHAQSIPETLSIQKFVQQINDGGDCSVEIFTRSPIKVIASVQRAEMVYRDGSEWLQSPIS